MFLTVLIVLAPASSQEASLSRPPTQQVVASWPCSVSGETESVGWTTKGEAHWKLDMGLPDSQGLTLSVRRPGAQVFWRVREDTDLSNSQIVLCFLGKVSSLG